MKYIEIIDEIRRKNPGIKIIIGDPNTDKKAYYRIYAAASGSKLELPKDVHFVNNGVSVEVDEDEYALEIKNLLEPEMRLAEALGFRVVKAKELDFYGNVIWNIKNSEGDTVGYIKCFQERVYDKATEDFYLKDWYEMSIETSRYGYKSKREIYDRNDNLIVDSIPKIEMRVTESSGKVSDIDFSIEDGTLRLYAPYKTSESRVLECLDYEDGNMYRYLHQENSKDSKYHSHYEIIGRYNPKSGSTHVDFSETGKNNGPYKFKGTPEELAKENKKGIEFFNNVRNWLKDYLSLDEDIFSILISEDVIEKYNLSMFFGGADIDKKGDKELEKTDL